MSASERITKLKRENLSLKIDLDIAQNNSAEAWQIIKSEWRRHDEENDKTGNTREIKGKKTEKNRINNECVIYISLFYYRCAQESV